MTKKIVIIGGGIAGLSAGCYAQMNGYETEIHEMHNLPGGLCTAWQRKGYTFDGCIHWLLGSKTGLPGAAVQQKYSNGLSGGKLKLNIGVIVFSQTGNTYEVAQKLKEKLASAGHSANIERVTITGEATPGAKNFQLNAIPAVDQYDALFFGAPVNAFSLAPAMTAYLNQLSSLQGKKIACFVTKQLPFYWTGGNRAIAQMKKICESKGAAVCGTEIVIWSKSQRDQNISRCIESLSSQISN